MAARVSWSYDREADVLYVDFGGAEPAYFEEKHEGLFIGRGLSSKSIVGMRVVGWRSTRARIRYGTDVAQKAKVHTEPWPRPVAGDAPLSGTGTATQVQEELALV